jgi:isopenicillin-N epimerase
MGYMGLASKMKTPPRWGVDFFVSRTHKWIFAPRGTGIIWAREDAWAILRPIIPSFTDEVETAWMEN